MDATKNKATRAASTQGLRSCCRIWRFGAGRLAGVGAQGHANTTAAPNGFTTPAFSLGLMWLAISWLVGMLLVNPVSAMEEDDEVHTTVFLEVGAPPESGPSSEDTYFVELRDTVVFRLRLSEYDEEDLISPESAEDPTVLVEIRDSDGEAVAVLSDWEQVRRSVYETEYTFDDPGEYGAVATLDSERSAGPGGTARSAPIVVTHGGLSIPAVVMIVLMAMVLVGFVVTKVRDSFLHPHNPVIHESWWSDD